ncbi:hypothetical protein RhiJN_15163 [Ceratobasidium sp. AG-Ba]|nr:hypothetical protein RhiJN_00236 [Ceratobasidium sp. AG-Ba]QRV87145.1 hypothetical protein RhiJN_15163 [Ceratobasidium sp. AG-Ba]QRW01269.1 hypothetical protein RhiLY_00266 [Ceratobasidium sp. AG-Ba]
MLNTNTASAKWADPALLPVYGLLAVTVYLVGRYVDQTYIRPPSKTGFGKGAPGFMTNVRKVAITPELAERLRRGEEVSPEEIAAAQEEAAKNPTVTLRRRDIVERDDRPATTDDSDREPDTRGGKKRRGADPSENEWIPEGHTRPAARHSRGSLRGRRKK